MFSSDADGWHWSMPFQPGINFCVWVLLGDGLRVPPFGYHADGNGLLRAAGMGPSSWREWLKVMVHLDDRRAAASPGTPRAAMQELRLNITNPPALWPGAPAARPLVDDLWVQFRPYWNDRKRQRRDEIHTTRNATYMTPSTRKELWQDLLPFHARLPTLRVYLVEYPWPVLLLVPPVSVIMRKPRLVEATDDAADLTALVRRAAQELAAQHASGWVGDD